ncbi:hypothetical protein RSAG8_06376, partial [Rhizoctonia solani AG-8 WAC10335]
MLSFITSMASSESPFRTTMLTPTIYSSYTTPFLTSRSYLDSRSYPYLAPDYPTTNRSEMNEGLQKEQGNDTTAFNRTIFRVSSEVNAQRSIPRHSRVAII